MDCIVHGVTKSQTWLSDFFFLFRFNSHLPQINNSSSSKKCLLCLFDPKAQNWQYIWVCVCVHAQLCLTLCDPVDCSPPGSSVCGISQVRILNWVAISSSRGSSWPRDRVSISCIRQMDALPLAPPGKPNVYLVLPIIFWCGCYCYSHSTEEETADRG